MHAGFFGTDCLVVVDEAHLSAPFVQTLMTLRHHGADIQVVPMSATLAAPSEQTLRLGAADLTLPTVQQRLQARKPARLLEAPGPESEFVNLAAAEATQLLERPGYACIAVVVNRVATARRCHSRLLARGIKAELLTGRVRQADRDQRLATLLPRLAAGRRRTGAEEPLVVVATQTIEVGADLDFDALVTEAAPISALRQRFGRLDRLGEHGTAEAVVLMRPDSDRGDSVYGDALAPAVGWLRAQARQTSGVLDFGLAALEQTLVSHPPPLEPERHAATLLPPHLQMLAQTGPFAPDMALSGWLHGASDQVPDVTLIWRDDLIEEDSSSWAAAMQLLPPMQREGLPIPLPALRRWLAGDRPQEGWGDAGAAVPEESGAASVATRAVLRWRGPDDCEVVAVADVRPGDTVVMPATFGGCDDWGWAPESVTPVVDLADECQIERLNAGASHRITLRLADGHWGVFGSTAQELRAKARQLQDLIGQASTSEADLSEDIEDAAQQLLALALASEHPLAAKVRDGTLERHPNGFVVRGKGTEEVEGIVETGRPVPLEVHHADVARWASALAADDPQHAAIVDAAAVHDAGKADPRMQAMLHGSALAAAGGPLLAKSALRQRSQQTLAWQSAVLPKGFRHELASLDFVAVSDSLRRHLVATHHGHARPWAHSCTDPDAPGARVAELGSGWQTQWTELIAQHGPWALGRMEWRLRAADARASIEEAQA